MPCYHLTSLFPRGKNLMKSKGLLRNNGRARRSLVPMGYSVRSSKAIFSGCSCASFQLAEALCGIALSLTLLFIALVLINFILLYFPLFCQWIHQKEREKFHDAGFARFLTVLVGFFVTSCQVVFCIQRACLISDFRGSGIPARAEGICHPCESAHHQTRFRRRRIRVS